MQQIDIGLYSVTSFAWSASGTGHIHMLFPGRWENYVVDASVDDMNQW